MSPPSSSIVQSVRQRLLNRARKRRESYELTLVRFAVERLLYRLGRSSLVDQYAVKGATLFAVWLEAPHRPTRDLDLHWTVGGKEEEVESHLREIFAQECPEDGLVFDASSLLSERIRQDQKNPGLRVKCVAYLGQARIPLKIDIGLADAVTPPPELEDYPTLLELPAPRVKLYPKETFVAEKLEAMVRYGRANTRYKDFSDVALLAREMSFQGMVLLEAVQGTFERCRTAVDPADLPAALGAAFYADPDKRRGWQAFAEENLLKDDLGSFPEVGERVMAFLEPVWQALAREIEFREQWSEGGPWR